MSPTVSGARRRASRAIQRPMPVITPTPATTTRIAWIVDRSPPVESLVDVVVVVASASRCRACGRLPNGELWASAAPDGSTSSAAMSAATRRRRRDEDGTARTIPGWAASDRRGYRWIHAAQGPTDPHGPALGDVRDAVARAAHRRGARARAEVQVRGHGDPRRARGREVRREGRRAPTSSARSRRRGRRSGCRSGAWRTRRSRSPNGARET